ncbi:MAG TPA: hypothetical protein V6D17_08375, partial [Candidatus Obscuribacterales bacterium]
VSPHNFDQLRPLNFGTRALVEPITEEAISKALANYDGEKAKEVCERLRASAQLKFGVDAYLKIYEQVLARSKQTAHLSLEEESRHFASYIESIAYLLPEKRKSLIDYRRLVSAMESENEQPTILVRNYILERMLKRALKHSTVKKIARRLAPIAKSMASD